MEDTAVLLQLGAVVVAATLALSAVRAAGFPPLLAYIGAGLILGPGAGLLAPTDSLALLSELGVALLLFLVGMELSVVRIREVGRTALVTGSLQMAVTLLLAWGLVAGAGFGGVPALVLALAVTFSSTVVVVKLLEATGSVTERHGRISIGVLLVQDVAVALCLTVVAGLGGGGPGDAAGLGPRLLGPVAGLVALAGVAAAAVRWGLGGLFRWLAASPEAAFVASLAWCLLFILGAEAAHLSVELGAFVAGVALAQLPGSAPLRRRVHPLVDFLLAVFFVTLGAGMEPGAALERGGVAAALVVLAVVGKPTVIAVVLGRLGQDSRTSVLAGLGLGQVSEFSFVLAGSAAAAGLVGPDVVSLVGLVGLASIAISALAVPRGEALHGLLGRSGLARLFGPPPEPVGRDGAAPHGHVVVVGMNALGRALVRELAGRAPRVVAVDTDPAKLRGLPAAAVVGDANLRSVVEEAGLARALLVVSALQIEETNRLLVHRCRRLGVPVSVHAFDPIQVGELEAEGADHLMVSKHAAARQIAGRLRELGVVG